MRQIVCVFALASLFGVPRASAQSPMQPAPISLAGPSKLADSLRQAIESAAEIGELDALEATVTLAERALAAYPGDALLRHYQAYALYRTSNVVMGLDGSGRVRPYLDRTRDILEPLVNKQPIPESMALLSSVYGMQIGAAKVPMLAGMKLGSKSTDLMERAVAEGPNNPRVWVLRGISAVHAPSMFGGGLDKAETYLKKALELFEKDAPPAPLPAWGRADAHIWLGQVYVKQKRRDLARAEFEAARAIQPRNGWVVNVLLPSLDRAP